jgi:L-serine dehydratase
MSPIGNVDAARTMHAARQFAQALRDDGLLHRTWRVKCELYRALDHAGRDRDVDMAVMLGLEGEEADCVDAAEIAPRLRRIHDKRELQLLGLRRIAFHKRHHLVIVRGDTFPTPSDGLRLSAFDPAGKLLLERSYDA